MPKPGSQLSRLAGLFKSSKLGMFFSRQSSAVSAAVVSDAAENENGAGAWLNFPSDGDDAARGSGPAHPPAAHGGGGWFQHILKPFQESGTEPTDHHAHGNGFGPRPKRRSLLTRRNSADEPPCRTGGEIAVDVPARRVASVDCDVDHRDNTGHERPHQREAFRFDDEEECGLPRKPSSGSLHSLAASAVSDGLDVSAESRNTVISEVTLMTYSDERAEVS